MRIGPLEIILILALIIAVFGSGNLPKLGRKAGESIRGFKENSKEITETVKFVKDEVEDIKKVISDDLAEKI